MSADDFIKHCCKAAEHAEANVVCAYHAALNVRRQTNWMSCK